MPCIENTCHSSKHFDDFFNFPPLIKFFVPTFEGNGIFMLDVVFLFRQFLPIEIVVFDENF